MIRRATPADANALSALASRAFSETFGHLYREDDLSAFLREVYAPDVLRAELADPDRATWLLFPGSAPSGPDGPCGPDGADCPDDADCPEGAGQSPVGYASARPAALPHAAVRPGDGEVQRLYVLSGHQGNGRGSALLATALRWLEREGPRPVWLGVWSGNPGAQRLYERHGFSRVGEYAFMVGSHADHELIYRRPPL